MPTALLVHELKTSKKFAEGLPALSEEVIASLRINLTKEGWRSYAAVVVWKEKGTILDGHNRYRICHELKIPFRIVELSFPTEDAAFLWMVYNALGTRSLTPEERRYQMGVVYNLEKKAQGPPKGSKNNPSGKAKGARVAPLGSDDNGKLKGSTAGTAPDAGKTRQKVADQFRASPRTVDAAAAFAEAIDTIARKAGPEAKATVLSGKIETEGEDGKRKKKKLTHEDVLALAKLNPKKLKDVLALPADRMAAALHPDRPTTADLKSPFTASDAWGKVMDNFAAFQGYANKHWPGGAQDSQEPDYHAMLASDKWDSSQTFGMVQILEEHILDVQRLKETMFVSLSEEQQASLNTR